MQMFESTGQFAESVEFVEEISHLLVYFIAIVYKIQKLMALWTFWWVFYQKKKKILSCDVKIFFHQKLHPHEKLNQYC